MDGHGSMQHFYQVVRDRGSECSVATLHAGPECPYSVNLSGSDLTELPWGLIVQGALELRRMNIARLPEGMRIRGMIDLRDTPLVALPDNLYVGRSILLGHSQIRTLPGNLRVRASLDLNHTPITALPASFRVEESLDLTNSQVQELPEGLHVGEHLNLRGTQVQRLPQDMFVGGKIYPSPSLLDIPAFMQGKPDVVVLSLKGSRHHRIDLQYQVGPFPDLWRIVQAMGEDRKLVLRRKARGRYTGALEHEAPV